MVLGLGLLLGLGGPGPARAQSTPQDFVATYRIAFLGLPVGEATLVLARPDDRYRIALDTSLRGLVGFFLDGGGTAVAAGRLSRDRAIPAAFTVDGRYAGKPLGVSMRIDGGRVTEATVEPEPTPRPDRIPVTAADKVGVVDPLTALLVPLGGAPLDPALCERRIAVFSGATRSDLVLSRGALVTAADGLYRGPALDCRVRWVPIAGHRANGAGVRRMAENDEMRVRLAPVPGGAMLAPLAISVPTGWGTVQIAATRWEAAPPARESSGPTGRAGVRLSLPNAR